MRHNEAQEIVPFEAPPVKQPLWPTLVILAGFAATIAWCFILAYAAFELLTR